MEIGVKDGELSLAAFERIAAAAGVRIEPEELEVMRNGYLGLQRILSRLPQTPDFFDEPATIFEPYAGIAR